MKIIKNPLKNKKGTSIVSVMAAFLILLLGIAMLYTSVTVSQNMVNTATARFDRNDTQLKEFYEQTAGTPSSGSTIGVYKKEGESYSDTVSFNVDGAFAKEENSGFYYFY